MTQPKALRLADLLLSENAMDCLEHSDDAAAELRRLHEENQALRQALDKPENEELLKQGWRQCAVGQRTTQYCGMAEQAKLEERKACWNILFDYAKRDDLSDSDESLLAHLADLIKARSEK